MQTIGLHFLAKSQKSPDLQSELLSHSTQTPSTLSQSLVHSLLDAHGMRGAQCRSSQVWSVAQSLSDRHSTQFPRGIKQTASSALQSKSVAQAAAVVQVWASQTLPESQVPSVKHSTHAFVARSQAPTEQGWSPSQGALQPEMASCAQVAATHASLVHESPSSQSDAPKQPGAATSASSASGRGAPPVPELLEQATGTRAIASQSFMVSLCARVDRAVWDQGHTDVSGIAGARIHPQRDKRRRFEYGYDLADAKNENSRATIAP